MCPWNDSKAAYLLFAAISEGKFFQVLHPVIEVSRKKKEKGLPNLLHPGFSGIMTGLNREKRCKLAAVFVQNFVQCSEEVVYIFFREFLQFIPRIYLFFRDLTIYSNAYGNGNHRARHAAAGFLAKTRYNFTRFGRVMFLHGPWTSGWYILPFTLELLKLQIYCNSNATYERMFFPLQQRMADQILTQLKQHPDAWTRVDTILEFSNNQQTKVWSVLSLYFGGLSFLLNLYNFLLQYFALQILEAVIKTRWKVLPSEQCEGKELHSNYTSCHSRLNFLLFSLIFEIKNKISESNGKHLISFTFRHKEIHRGFDNKNFVRTWYARGACFVFFNVWFVFS